MRIRTGHQPWQWQDMGHGAAISPHSGIEGGQIVPRPRPDEIKPPPKPVQFPGEPLKDATPRQLEALDAFIGCRTQIDAAHKLGIGERGYRKLLTPLRESSGLTVLQLALVRDRERRAAA